MYQVDNPKNSYKNTAHAFFLALAITIAEPSTILPLIIHHFSDSVVMVGLFTSLLRGGAITIQLYAAFHAQAYRRVLPYLRKVFFFRFLSWFAIGASIYLIGDNNKTLTLFAIGVGLFLFSFTAGFGAIYFKELQAKVFSKEYRGKAMANRQIAGATASIISGSVAGYVLNNYEPPESYAYLFMVSSLIMVIGFSLFATIDEPPKEKILVKERHFGIFIKNAVVILREDRRLQRQILALFLSYGYLLSLPFIILKANSSFTLTGWMLGGFITIGMVGSILGSTFLWRRVSDYEKMLSLSFIFLIIAFTIALSADSIYQYALIFFLIAIGVDGLSNSGMNLVIEIAPEDKRPIYTALQTNIVSFGLFFPILGGVILKITDSYTLIYGLTISLLSFGFFVSLKLSRGN